MTKGKPFKATLEQVREALYESGGNIPISSNMLGCCVRKLYDYIDDENLSGYLEKIRHTDGRIREDLSLTAIDRLLIKLDEEPSIALKAALETLKRKGSTRKDWTPDSQLSSQEVAILKQMLQNEIGTPTLPQA